MCTYRGERYLDAQLSSLERQTRLPDELVVLDDRSDDRTAEILERFVRRSPFPVRFSVNEQRLGWVKNFEEVLRRPVGDVIFFADQDDVWHPEKIEKLLQGLSTNPGAGFAFCDGEMVDEELRPLGTGIWEAFRFGDAERRSVESDGGIDHLLRQFRHVAAPGMTIAFRAVYRDLVLPFPDLWWHDGLIPKLLAAVGAGPVIVPERLVQWRQHSSQRTGLPLIRVLEKQARRTVRTRSHANQVKRCRVLLERLAERAAEFPPDPRAMAILEERVQHAERRLEARSRRWKLGTVWRELRTGNYRKYSRGWWSAAKDLLP